MKKPIRLFWWREADGIKNYGDDLSPIIVGRVSGRRVKFSHLKRCDLVALGSIADITIRSRRKRILRHPFRKTLVWGAGSFGAPPPPGQHYLDIHAVRGPRTRKLLSLPDCTPIGDPGLLLREIIEKPIKKRYRWGVIPHTVHRNHPRILHVASNSGAKIIDLATDDPLKTAREIAACHFIISSSLHGIITADAFGIPNAWMATTPPLYGGHWKFHDYFESVDRTVSPMAPPLELHSLESQLKCANDSTVYKLCGELLRSFPELS